MVTAPAPSPNRMHVFRSPQSTHRDMASAPTTRAASYVPVSRNWDAVTNANKNPEHAAVMSNATAFLQPHWSATFAASPNKSSGVDVATMTSPTTAGSRPERSRAFCAADAAWSAMDSPGCRTRLDRMPVRCEIHSLLRAVLGRLAPQLRTVLSSVAWCRVRGACLIA